MVRISKEKTVKIIPNAIAVATPDGRHVFSSFLSRESAYQLMIRIWQNALPNSDIDVLTASAQLRICTDVPDPSDVDTKLCTDESIFAKVNISPMNTLQVVQQRRHSGDLDISELDDDSSSAISGNEGLTHLLQSTNLADEPHPSSSSSNNNNHCDLMTMATTRDSTSDFDLSKSKIDADSVKSSTPIVMTGTKKSILDTSTINLFKFRIPRTIHIAYFGLSLVIILTLIAIFLFYRIIEMKSARMKNFSADDLNAVSYSF